MAPAEDSPTFQKLRLNTRASPKPIPSAFASIKRNDGEHPGSPFPELDDSLWPHEDSAVALTDSELADNAFPSDHEGMYIPDKRSWMERKKSDQYMLSGSSRRSPSLEQAFSQRHRAISFAPKVTLDGGDRFPMDAPLPKPDSYWGKEEASSVIEPDDEGQEIPDHSGYFIGKQIGFGGFSVVKEVSTIQDGVKIIRAVKIVRKQVTGKDETENEKLQTEFEHEVEIWRYLKHPYILPLLTVYDTPFATFCITKMNTGGTLFDLIRANRKTGNPALPSKLAKRYLYQLASALRYLHEDVHVVHRDIKLENCLLDMSDPDAKTEGGNVLVCDFGMADFITNENRNMPSPLEESAYSNVGPSDTSTCVNGSLDYASPELLHARTPLYSAAVDMWAHNFQPALVMLITKGEWDEEALREVGADEDAIELVRGCLEMDPQLRCTIADVLECPWFDGCSELYEDVRREWVDST
ncbi:putative serine threonine-protein kinase dclk1 [Diplodia seriata]|uniref:Putative serine threonine-protein kinase dclk1 n=1 Tax=Diplodia seriata TaxID=420778 RepID=A0A0G2DUR2_9PEZI|nr:putative serine threonine-protein kinase dclk1 [Diplodia seriata]